MTDTSDASPEWNIFTKDNSYTSEFLGTEADKTWSGDFFFVQGCDPQLGLMAAFRNPEYIPSEADWTEELRLAKLAVKKVNQLKPKPRFFVICGDLTNEFPTVGCLETKEKQIKDFKKAFSRVKSEIPLICVCGNHDVGDTPTVETINKYRSTYGDDYFSFWCKGVFFIVLNSQYFKDPTLVPHLAEEQEQWLDNQLSAAAGSRIICFSHIPWFIHRHDEAENKIFTINLETRMKILDKLYNAGVRHFFCGHYHRNGGGYYKDLELVITSAIGLQLGQDKSGLRIVKVTKDKVSHRYYSLEEVPKTIEFD